MSRYKGVRPEDRLHRLTPGTARPCHVCGRDVCGVAVVYDGAIGVITLHPQCAQSLASRLSREGGAGTAVEHAERLIRKQRPGSIVEAS